ncbi:hypothetical protein PHMEG_00034798 [Phytophthora megakarya]|uniref:Uncharacterized protein n=1 Tax=Phytophthora megakarya TaxID=4795 RepID=A0A225URP8_9STRA|nr:hypothetical protein PHMEG_00034798 [Phytophthora megakarya]
MPPVIRTNVIANMTIAYANASLKLAIQWISTRAFAYIITTTKEDQCVAKGFAGYKAPGLPVPTPSICDLQQRLPVVKFGPLITLRNELYRHAFRSEEVRFNIAGDVIDATFATLLMHMEAVKEATENSGTGVQVPHYLYELERGIAPV